MDQIAEEKGIPREKIIETIEMAIAAAYKKDYGRRGQMIRAEFSPESGAVRFFRARLVVDESMVRKEEELETEAEPEEPAQKSSRETIEAGPPDFKDVGGEESEKVRFNPEKHIMFDEAHAIDPKLKLDDELVEELKTETDYGRIAAQTAKQVIIQRLREAERESILSDFQQKEDQVISGIIQRIEGGTVFLDLGRAYGILLPSEQIPREEYRIGMRLQVYVLKSEDSPKGPLVFVSRAHPKILSRLFELEVPEITNGTVVIKFIAREPGSRSKVAVTSTEERIDPIGSCVGQKGTRVLTIINELGGEKIDIIAWDEKMEKFIANALAPAKVFNVEIDKNLNKAVVAGPDDQLSLAIGKGGQNVRLAAKLTGWKIDVKSSEITSPEEIPQKEAKEEKVKKAVKGRSAKKSTEKSASPKKKKANDLKTNELKDEAPVESPPKEDFSKEESGDTHQSQEGV